MAEKEEKSGVGDLSKNKYPTYVLYRYHTNRNTSDSSGDDVKTKSEPAIDGVTLVSGTSKKEQSADFSLTVVISGLSAEHESLFGKFISRRLAKGAVRGNGGHISGLDMGSSGPLLCYYSLLDGESSPPPSISSKHAPQTSPPDDAPQGSVDAAYLSSQFLLCLIAPAEAVLDLFRPELDKYCKKLLTILDADLCEIAVKIRPHLEDWFGETSEYLCRCVQLLNDDVKYLINAALLDAEVIIECPNKKTASDLQRFVECCSLSDLLQVADSNDGPEKEKSGSLLVDINVSDPSGKPVVVSQKKASVKLTFEGDSCKFDNLECSKFCADWGTALTSGDVDNPVHLRQIIENFRLRAIQDMNNLKRLLRQAESDYYSLFRCYVFLKSCGNASILLQHAQSELNALESADALNVLNVLQEFIKDVKVVS